MYIYIYTHTYPHTHAYTHVDIDVGLYTFTKYPYRKASTTCAFDFSGFRLEAGGNLCLSGNQSPNIGTAASA